MNILYVEDDPGLGHLLSRHLRKHEHSVSIASGVVAARQALNSATPDVMLCDHDLPDGTGLELMKAVIVDHPELPCIMLTGVGSEALAVEAMKAGARDYVVKDIENNFLTLIPVIVERVCKALTLKRSLVIAEQEKGKLEARNRYLSSTLRKQTAKDFPIGQDASFKKVLTIIEQVAPTDVTVLITGETGTGKEKAAQLIHDLSPRAEQPFITVNCAALPAQLVESELFGHEKGAFTGAVKSHIGRFEAADGGTLFLDEIGELPVELQPKLLRALQESNFQRVGGSVSQSADVRIIAATNQNLAEQIAEHTFREDLYYRLNVIPVHMPPLRERSSDIELLFLHFLRQVSNRHGLPPPPTTATLLQSIRRYTWPGNVRELINYVERGVVTQHWEHSMETTPQMDSIDDQSDAKCLTLAEIENSHIRSTLRRTSGVIAGDGGAAQLLGLNANTLRSRMKKLGIRKPGF